MSDSESSVDEAETGLPWPKSWKGVYLFVIGTFVFWVALLIMLTEFYS